MGRRCKWARKLARRVRQELTRKPPAPEREWTGGSMHGGWTQADARKARRPLSGAAVQLELAGPLRR